MAYHLFGVWCEHKKAMLEMNEDEDACNPNVTQTNIGVRTMTFTTFRLMLVYQAYRVVCKKWVSKPVFLLVFDPHAVFLCLPFFSLH